MCNHINFMSVSVAYVNKALKRSLREANYFLAELLHLVCASKASLNSFHPSVFLNSSSLIPSSSSLDSESC